MVHPFAHLNSLHAKAAFESLEGDFTQRRRAEFAAFLQAAGGGTAAAVHETLASPRAPGGEPPGLALRARAADSHPQLMELSVPAGDPGSPLPGAGNQSAAPHFPDVPDSAKFPLGPYRQAPPEHGGEWWFVSPFTGPEPWKPAEPSVTEGVEPAPADFLALFGARPERGDHSVVEHQIAVNRWEQDLRHFQGVGLPEGIDPAQAELAAQVFEAWGMGRPVFYQGRYGWVARFPDSAFPDFEANPRTAVEASHLVIAQYQVKLLQEGVTPEQKHPFVPPRLFEGGQENGLGHSPRSPHHAS